MPLISTLLTTALAGMSTLTSAASVPRRTQTFSLTNFRFEGIPGGGHVDYSFDVALDDAPSTLTRCNQTTTGNGSDFIGFDGSRIKCGGAEDTEAWSFNWDRNSAQPGWFLTVYYQASFRPGGTEDFVGCQAYAAEDVGNYTQSDGSTWQRLNVAETLAIQYDEASKGTCKNSYPLN